MFCIRIPTKKGAPEKAPQDLREVLELGEDADFLPDEDGRVLPNEASPVPLAHKNIRGSGYYSKDSNEPGTGKSYLACALGHEACKRGYRTFYANAPKLLGALKVAKIKGTLETELRKIERCQLLILDDLFLVPLDAKERPILLEIIEDRHERKSIIITSQYPSSNWYDMVGDPTIADAILDRIIHTAHTIELYGESMRKLRAKK